MKTDIYLKQALAQQSLVIARCPDIFAFYASLNRFFLRNYEFEGETHPAYELVYVIKGSVGVTAGAEVYRLDAGQMILHPPDEFHRIWSESESEPHILNLSFYAASMPFYNGRVLQPEEDEGKVLLDICEQVRRGLKNADRRLLNEQRLLLELWLLRVLGRGGTNLEPSDAASALRYAEIVALLRDHIGEPLTAQDIAMLSAMSVSSLKKIFTRYAGMGVVRFFTEMKMQHAAVLLKSGKRVGEIAAEIGYSDKNYFSTVFHRVMGMSPVVYRTALEKKRTPNENI